MCDATGLRAQEYAPKGGRPTKRGHEVVVVEAEEGHPPTPKGKAPTPAPKPSKVAKVVAQSPPSPLDVGGLHGRHCGHPRDGRLQDFGGASNRHGGGGPIG